MTGNNVRQPDERIKAQRALELRTQGLTWQAISDELGYADRSGARKAADRLLQQFEYETVDEARVLEGDRLDALWRSYWPAALAGDLKAAEFCLKISDRRCKLLGLDRPTRVALEGLPTGEDFAETAVALMAEILDAEATPPPAVDPDPWVR